MKTLFLFLTSLLILCPCPAMADDIHFLTHNLGDQAYRSEATGELMGVPHSGKRSFDLEVVRRLQKMLGEHGTIDEVTFVRGMELVENGRDMALFNVYRTPEREARFKWVGPLHREISYLYGLKEEKMPATLAEARSVTAICVVEGNAHHTALGQSGFDNLVTTSSYDDCFRRLRDGQVELAAAAEESLPQILQTSGIPALSLHRVPEILTETAGYIAFSPSTDIETIQLWQGAFNALVGSGDYQELYDEFYAR